jgi:hypothetical protein
LDINDRYIKTRTRGKKSCVSLSGSCPRLWRHKRAIGSMWKKPPYKLRTNNTPYNQHLLFLISCSRHVLNKTRKHHNIRAGQSGCTTCSHPPPPPEPGRRRTIPVLKWGYVKTYNGPPFVSVALRRRRTIQSVSLGACLD